MRSLLSVIAALLLGCSTRPPCDSSCAGCCDSTGECVAGTAQGRCGARGESCQRCRADEGCVLGQCTLVGSGGGSATGGGTGTGGGGGTTGGGTADGGVTDAGVTDGGVTDGGSQGCATDFDCPASHICDGTGSCVAGTSCTSDFQCQSLDPLDRCFRFGTQCVCDTDHGNVCRVRKRPCDVCASDLECGSDPIVFGPPDGLGAGRCRALPADPSGLKFCSYQRVGNCPCGKLDDGTGYCRPQSNSCASVGCNVDQNCPTSLACTVNVPDAGVASCGGTCVADRAPIAQLTVCTAAQLINDPTCLAGATSSASFSLAALNPDELTFSGLSSSDDHRVVECRFTLLPPLPAGVTTAALMNHGVRSPVCVVKLTLPPNVSGTLRVGLEVWDDADQQSPASSVLTVNVSP